MDHKSCKQCVSVSLHIALDNDTEKFKNDILNVLDNHDKHQKYVRFGHAVPEGAKKVGIC